MLVILSLFATSCSQDPGLDSVDVQQNLKTVVLTADMGGTKASINSETGAFSWQSGDLISVLATDGKFYDFIVDGESGKSHANFIGSIPESAEITTVATYPRVIANGSDNTIYSNGILTYSLPSEWTWAKDVSNVPMVAAFNHGDTHLQFKQVGGLLRFPVKNLPKDAKFVLTIEGKTITGDFPIELATLGTSAMVAGESTSTLTINYSADVMDGVAEMNVPVPTGVYNKFNVTIKDANDNVLLTKDYEKAHDESDWKVERANLVVMDELVLDVAPMAISEVWPFFVDARVVFSKYAGVEEYAVYVDGATTPVIVEAEELGDMAAVLVGGNFDHNTTHTVAVAKVVDGQVVAETKSATIEFTTADIRQLTTNTGTKFVSVGWDDVSIENGPKYVNGKWTTVSSADYPDVDAQGRKLHQRRGYQVQLLDAESNVVYDMIPFDGHSIHQNAFYDSNTIGKTSGNNLVTPTAISFSHLEPGKDYYFRVKTIDDVVDFDLSKGNYIAEGNTDKPYPYPLSSERGGSGWSNLVKLSTDPIHTPSENEVFHEGFDDIMVSFDYVNWAVGVVPDLETETRQGWADYVTVAKTAYPEFLQTPASERKWTVHGFNQRPRVDEYGLFDGELKPTGDNFMNANAGSMEGWSVRFDINNNAHNTARNIYPMFGAIAFGQAINSHGGATIITSAINSDKLLNNVATKCIVKMKVSYLTANKVPPAPKRMLIARYKDGNIISEKEPLDVSVQCPEEWNTWYTQYHTDANNYVNYQHYYEVEHEMYLKKGESIFIEKYTEGTTALREYGWFILGDIQVEVVPGEFDMTTFVDDGVGTAPNDNINYDVFGLGELPITYYYGPPTAWYGDDQAKAIATYQDIKDAGFNIATYVGEMDWSIAEQKRILEICEDLDMKFFSSAGGGTIPNESVISEIKEHLYPSSAYLGDFLRDEPSATEFDAMANYVSKFLAQMPDKEVYNNLYPMYTRTDRLGTQTYEQHILEYLDKVPTKSLSYDYYGLLKEHELGYTYYQNLDLVRSKTLAAQKPFWVITQAGPIGTGTKDPSEEEQRFTVWSNLALGSKGIAYFTYWTPGAEANLGDVGFMVLRDGTKRPIYYWIKQINEDIKTIGKKLLYCHADGVIMNVVSYPLWDNDSKGRTNYGPVKKLTAGNSNSVMLGCFRDARTAENGDNYKGYKVLAMAKVQNFDTKPIIELDSSITQVAITQNNTTKNLTLVNGLSETIEDITVSYLNNELTLSIPSGEAALIEF